MSVNLSFIGGAGWQFFDNNGDPLSGGLLYTYVAGTTTPAATYTASVGMVANANPIVLDAAGRVPEEIWLSDAHSYKFILTTSANVQIWVKDNISGVSNANAVASDLTTYENTLASSAGASLIGFLQTGATAVSRTVQSKLRDTLSVKDFGAVGNGSTDDTTAIQNAIDTAAFSSQYRSVYFPAGTYIIQGTLRGGTNLNLIGDGIGISILKKAPASAGHILDVIGSSTKENVTVSNLTFECNFIDAGFEARSVKNFLVDRCEFRNTPFWGLIISTTTSSSSTIVNENVRVQNCVFYNTTQTYEHLLVLNSQNVFVENCDFSVAPNGIGIGIYQNVDTMYVRNCTFYSMKTASYYSISCRNIYYDGCRVDSTVAGIQGANLSDNGSFGYTYAENVNVSNCYFTNNTDVGVTLGAVKGAVVSGSWFDSNKTRGITVNSGGIGAPDALSINICISNCTFRNNNASNIGSVNAPGISFDEIGGSMNAVVSNCNFFDDKAIKTQLFSVAFNGAFTWSDVLFVNCTMNGYSGGTSIGLANSAVIGSNVWMIDCMNTTNSVATGVRRKASGTGTPENVIVAGVGSTFLRTDGGAGTTLYVKQTGTGSTGWVGK